VGVHDYSQVDVEYGDSYVYSLPRLHLYEVVVGSTKNSLFGTLSLALGTHIDILVVKVSEELYLTLATTNLSSFDMLRFKEIYKVFRRNVLGVHVNRERSTVTIVAAKYKCPFYELVDSVNVVLVPTYSYDSGVRKFFIAGSPDRARKLFNDLREVYGDVDVRRVRWSRVVEERRKYVIRSLLSNLTERQRTVLEKAYRSGYFDDVKKLNLATFSEVVNGAKSSVSITIRRALRKILSEVYSVE